jgi:hypothetical protein
MSSILSRIGVAWRDAVRDIILIVVSILIAFALDAWWDDQLDRQRERAHLETLLAEFHANRDRLEGFLGQVNDSFDSTLQVLALMGPAPQEISPDVLTSLINESFDVGTFTPHGGAVEALLASGELSLIQNHELSAMLSQWPVASNLLHDLAESQARNREELHIYLARSGVPVSRIAENLDWLEIPRSKFEFDPESVLVDMGIETYLVSRAVRLGFLRDQYTAALKSAEAIITLLETDLSSR